MLTRSTLPVRSPLPNRQPSMRSAPAISANSPAAVPVPRSLCGCTDSTIESRRARWRCIHSIMSAKMFGVECSTVDGRLMMHLRSRRRLPDLGDRVDDAFAERELGAGEHLRRVLEAPVGAGLLARPGRGPAARATVASSTMPSSSRPSTTRRITGEVALYRCTIARRAPRSDSKVRRISGSRACVSTWMVTSSGISSSLDQQPHEVEVGLRSRRETDLDLLEADPHQHLEHAQLALGVHRLDQRLVAVAQVDAAPDRRRVRAPRRARCGRQAAPARRLGTWMLRLLQHRHDVLHRVVRNRSPQMQTARCVAWRAVDPETSRRERSASPWPPRRSSETVAGRIVMRGNIARSRITGAGLPRRARRSTWRSR